MNRRSYPFSLVLVALLLGSCGAPIAEEDDRQELPGVQDVFSAAREAMGGSARLQQVESIRAIADCLSPGGPYTTEILSARQRRTWFKQSQGESLQYVAILHGEHGWSPAGNQGVIILNERQRAMIAGHEFQMMAIDLGTRFSAARVEETEEFSGSRCIRVRMTDTLGAPLDAYFHRGSHLLAGLRLANPMQDGEDVWIRVVEWQTVEGVKLPSKVIATDDSGDFILSFRQISINDVDASVFDLPQGVADE